jgi:hypothetical protein
LSQKLKLVYNLRTLISKDIIDRTKLNDGYNSESAKNLIKLMYDFAESTRFTIEDV